MLGEEAQGEQVQGRRGVHQQKAFVKKDRGSLFGLFWSFPTVYSMVEQLFCAKDSWKRPKRLLLVFFDKSFLLMWVEL
jgi:hypothetical protein